jgi:SAM-dependent methyltransferase
MATRRPSTVTVRSGTVDEASAYRSQSRASWEAAAGAWEREQDAVAYAARNITPWLVDHLELEPGQVVLELAAGTGETGIRAASIVGPAGRVIETDQAPAMVEAALRRAAGLGLANVEAYAMDAERLDLPDGSIDGVVCRWGLMLMADPAACLAEVVRVLRPGGRFAAAVWGAADENPWPEVVFGVLLDEGLLQPSSPGGPGVFALGDEQRLAALVAGSGLEGTTVERIPASWRYTDEDEYWRVQTSLSTSTARTLAGLDPDRVAAIRARVVERLRPYRTDDGLELPGVSLGVAARRPL